MNSVLIPGLGQCRVAQLVLDGECPGLLLESPGDFPVIAPAIGLKLVSEDILYTITASAAGGSSDCSLIGRTFVFYSRRPLPQFGGAA